jgi:hypothetical protein
MLDIWRQKRAWPLAIISQSVWFRAVHSACLKHAVITQVAASRVPVAYGHPLHLVHQHSDWRPPSLTTIWTN